MYCWILIEVSIDTAYGFKIGANKGTDMGYLVTEKLIMSSLFK